MPLAGVIQYVELDVRANAVARLSAELVRRQAAVQQKAASMFYSPSSMPLLSSHS